MVNKTKGFIACLLLIFGTCQFIGAQTANSSDGDTPPKEKTKNATTINGKKVEIFRDRLVLDVFHAFWLGMPKQDVNGVAINNKKFNPGFSLSAMWDFKLPNDGPIKFGLGLGVSYYAHYTNARFIHGSMPDRVMNYEVPAVPDSTIKMLKMNYVNCYIPLEFRYRHQNGFKLTLGVRVGLVAEVSESYKGKDDQLNNIHQKTYDIFNKQKYNFDVYTRIGWKFVNVFYSFQINKLFVKDKGPQICPMSVGISLSIF
ncbi:MAG: hypothetical protein LBV46_01795 [Bacteroidales bacterium]|jgi:hypothetical protein|nr:hypothetical protein [Bacteroidales bacterium]